MSKCLRIHLHMIAHDVPFEGCCTSVKHLDIFKNRMIISSTGRGEQ